MYSACHSAPLLSGEEVLMQSPLAFRGRSVDASKTICIVHAIQTRPLAFRGGGVSGEPVGAGPGAEGL